MTRPVIWIPRRLSDATLERAQTDYECIINWEDDLSGAARIVEIMQNLMQRDQVIAISPRKFVNVEIAHVHMLNVVASECGPGHG